MKINEFLEQKLLIKNKEKESWFVTKNIQAFPSIGAAWLDGRKIFNIIQNKDPDESEFNREKCYSAVCIPIEDAIALAEHILSDDF